MNRWLVTPDGLAAMDEVAIFDCRYDLMKPDEAVASFAKGHVPGAVHAHVDHDLAAPPEDGQRGRHPLPTPEAFAAFLGRHGVTPATPIVAYDGHAGQWASRLWWLCRNAGHKDVRLLDGGIRAWTSAGLPLEEGDARPRKATEYPADAGHMPTITAEVIEAQLGRKARYDLVDVRAGERYRGEEEPIDAQAGHVPGAINIPFAGNVDGQGRFLPADRLRERYEQALGLQEVGRVAAYCGSGVTATHAILAMEMAGLGTASLYPGSWSEWCYPESERPLA